MNYRLFIAVFSGLLLLIGFGLVIGEQSSDNPPPFFTGDTLPPSAP
jgi:hypothetical protein